MDVVPPGSEEEWKYPPLSGLQNCPVENMVTSII